MPAHIGHCWAATAVVLAAATAAVAMAVAKCHLTAGTRCNDVMLRIVCYLEELVCCALVVALARWMSPISELPSRLHVSELRERWNVTGCVAAYVDTLSCPWSEPLEIMQNIPSRVRAEAWQKTECLLSLLSVLRNLSQRAMQGSRELEIYGYSCTHFRSPAPRPPPEK